MFINISNHLTFQSKHDETKQNNIKTKGNEITYKLTKNNKKTQIIKELNQGKAMKRDSPCYGTKGVNTVPDAVLF